MPAPASSRTRLIVLGAVVAAILAIIVVAVATGGDDDSATTSTAAGPAVIESPASVTGITGIGQPTPITGDIATDSSSDIAGLGVVQRSLVEAGSFDCTTPGTWQPFGELTLTISVGEPAAGSTCTGDVVDMPIGSCSASPCSTVPETWRIETRPGVQPESLLLLVAPSDETSPTAEYVCVVGLIAQPKQILLNTTTIDQACPTAGTSNSIEIPYIPPDTSDIYVPPPASVDIVTG